MKLVSSPLALELVLALAQRREGGRLAELAEAVRAPLSSVQAAMRILLADRLVQREARRRPRYALADSPARDAVIDLAARYLPVERALGVVLRSNPAVEFAARDRHGHLVVEAPLADPRDLALLDRATDRIATGRDRTVPITRLGHHEVVDVLRDDPALRLRASRASRLKGSLPRSFPQHGAATGSARGAALRLPSRRALAALACRYGLRRVRLFGSAARGRLASGSDVDVLVESLPTAQLSLLELVRLEAELEQLLDRHADVVTPGGLRDDVREAVEREALTIYG